MVFKCKTQPTPIQPKTLKVRMLAASGAVSRAIAAELKKDGPGTSEAAARRAYQALWPSKAKLQRDFHVFGGEFLMAQPASTLRGFFNGFFKLPLPLWAVRTWSVGCCAMCSRRWCCCRCFVKSCVQLCLFRTCAVDAGGLVPVVGVVVCMLPVAK